MGQDSIVKELRYAAPSKADDSDAASSTAGASSVEEGRELKQEQTTASSTPKKNGGTAALVAAVLLIVVLALPTAIILAKSNESESDATLPSSRGAFATVDILPDYTLEAIKENEFSPQARALRWAEETPEFQEFEDWRKLQYFTIVTMFYQYGFKKWNERIVDFLLKGVPDECSSFVSYVFNDFSSPKVCNDQGRIVHYNHTEFRSLNPVLYGPIVKEIAMLTSLEVFEVKYERSLFGKIPSEFQSLTSLRTFNFERNLLTGTLMTEVGKLTRLEHFSVFGNEMTGPVPSELGLLTDLRTLNLGYNHFTGTFPPEVCALPKLESFAMGCIDGMACPDDCPICETICRHSVWLPPLKKEEP